MSEMTAAVSPSFKPTRPPSESASTIDAHRRPKTRDVASRYLTTSSFSSSSLFQSSPSPSSSAKRCQSPIVTRTNRPATPSATHRTQSTGRRELVTPRRDSLDRRGGGEVSSAQRMLLTSGRGLFATFQADSFTPLDYNRSKINSSPTVSGRKTTSTATPRSGGAHQEKSKLSEQWPRSLQPSSMSRSVDFTDTRKKPSGSINGVARALQNSMVSNRPVSRGRIKADSSSVDSSKAGSCSHISDTESVSSVSSNERGKKLPARGIVVNARFSQLPSNRSQHHNVEPASPVAKLNGLRTLESPKLIVVPRKNSVDSPVLSPKGVATTRSQLFPKREQIRPASPSNYGINASASSPRGTSIARGISPSRGVIPSRGISPSSGRMSPIRMRTSLSSNSTPLVLNFAVDAKKDKIRENGLADAHLLRLFHNRLLKWRFVNARANAVISAQNIRVERSLYNAWISISKLYDSARVKRIEMQHLKQNMKLISILNRQMVHLEEWALVERDYMGSLVGAAEALKGSTLFLPLDCGAMVNVESVKDAICSAVDVMQAMACSICLLLPKVVRISCLAAELGHVNVKEQGMLDLCRDLLNTISALQVTECSLRTQALQLQYQSPELSNNP
ncbi:unnamed protein product [Arabis nemorensis]|uniref:Uncharacterized protein n=1 Tax=Arabis nemorensis TaxID=586526 RepID=A0A565BKT1_9BRAS|nr:unnamed protein product [Arabis nemorensis]